MPFKIVRNDITRMQVDVIVNPANEAPVYAAGTDTAVYKAAGEIELLKARSKIGYMKEGEAAITPGFKLPAKYIIHAVSPRYIDGESGEEEKLRSCYRRSLQIAYKNNCKSIAFPLIATGNFGYPKEEGMRIALDEINAFLMLHDMLIYLVVFDTKATQLGLNLYPNLEAYIDHNYVCEKREEEYGDRYFGSVPKGEPEYNAYQLTRNELEERLQRPAHNRMMQRPVLVPQESIKKPTPKSAERDTREFEWLPVCESVCEPKADKDDFLGDAYFDDLLESYESALEERMKHLSDTFQQYLMYLISVKKLTNADVYKRALVTKQVFSKIKLNPNYHPDKATAMRLCVGAKLNLDETKDLLARAGYALSPCDKRDVIFSFFIEHEIFDMIEIDIALGEYELPCFIQ